MAQQDDAKKFRWQPSQYLKFASPRLRPALDLLNQINLASPQHIYDLGCGPGNVTQFIKSRWPTAFITGVDSSADMLKQASIDTNNDPSFSWAQADLDHWQPDQMPDLLYSNACLHWLDNHEALFVKLMSYLAPNGVLAVQMPNNFNQPTHSLARETALEGPWRDQLAPIIRQAPILSPKKYLEILAPLAASVDAWETCYYHVLTGDNPVVEWTKGSALKPYLDACVDDQQRQSFLSLYAEKVLKNYPKQSNGTTVMAFHRLFIVATNSA